MKTAMKTATLRGITVLVLSLLSIPPLVRFKYRAIRLSKGVFMINCGNLSNGLDEPRGFSGYVVVTDTAMRAIVVFYVFFAGMTSSSPGPTWSTSSFSAWPDCNNHRFVPLSARILASFSSLSSSAFHAQRCPAPFLFPIKSVISSSS